MPSPDFSPIALEYSRSRPGYPPELFERLASLVDRHDLAWDCATGSGQAAQGLAPWFRHVLATDLSAAQIAHARPAENIEYRVAAAEHSGLEPRSADLIAVAAALHWLDLDGFQDEARRVARPGGVVAAWTYHVAHVDPPFDEVFSRFYWRTARAHFSDRVELVDRLYETVELPGEPIEIPRFHATARWSLERLFEFVRTWSGVQTLLAVAGESALAELERELEALWGDPARERVLRWPLFVRAGRL